VDERLAASPRRILVLGATSQIGFFVVPLLAQRGISVEALTRRPGSSYAAPHPSVHWHTYAPASLAASLESAGPFDAAVGLVPLPKLLPLLSDLAKVGVRRLLAFGTTSRFSKQDSADRGEQDHR